MAYITRQGVRIHYQLTGRGEPLILQHGFSMSLEDWREYGYVDSLKKHFRLILLDARGHGASDKPHDSAAYTLETMVGDFVALLDELKIERAHYWGYSMGGGLGFGFARYHPERIRKLIIASSGAVRQQPKGVPRVPPSEGQPEDWMTHILNQGPEGLVNMWHDSLYISPDHKQRLLENDVEALAAYWRTPWPSLSDLPPKLTMPCLFYAGDSDVERQEVLQEAAAAAPAAGFISLPGLDHFTTWARSDMILPSAIDFLRAPA